MSIRLNQWLARAGVASRRGAEELIRAGRVRVNGRVERNPATRCGPGRDLVELDGRPITICRPLVVIALNKPAGYTTTRRDPHARRTVMDLLTDAPAGLHPVGRLDTNSRGLLLLTNDGDITFRLTHPKYGVKKVYRVRVNGVPRERTLEQLRRGILLADGRTSPADVKLLSTKDSSALLEVVLVEGRKRQVRRMFAAVGHPVADLQRIAVGPVRLGRLPEGKWRQLNPAEVTNLKKYIGREPLPIRGGDPSTE